MKKSIPIAVTFIIAIIAFMIYENRKVKKDFSSTYYLDSNVLIYRSGHYATIPEDFNIKTQLEKMRNADPLSDAKIAYSKSEKFLLGIISIDISIPGIKFRSYQINKSKIMIIAGTSDIISNDSELSEFSKVAYKYCEKFNLEMISLHFQDDL